MKTKTFEALGVSSVVDFSDDELYRYSLSRSWRSDSIRRLYFIMLNPSTADERVNDATIERCQRRAVRGGYCGLTVLNLFAFRATDPAVMRKAADPVGADNDSVIRNALAFAHSGSGEIVCGWGTHGTFKDRDKQVLALFKEYGIKPLALKISKDGHPCHPLYLSNDLTPQPFNPRGETQ